MLFVVVLGTNCVNEILSDRSRAQGALESERVDWSGLRTMRLLELIFQTLVDNSEQQVFSSAVLHFSRHSHLSKRANIQNKMHHGSKMGESSDQLLAQGI